VRRRGARAPQLEGRLGLVPVHPRVQVWKLSGGLETCGLARLCTIVVQLHAAVTIVPTRLVVVLLLSRLGVAIILALAALVIMMRPALLVAAVVVSVARVALVPLLPVVVAASKAVAVRIVAVIFSVSVLPVARAPAALYTSIPSVRAKRRGRIMVAVLTRVPPTISFTTAAAIARARAAPRTAVCAPVRVRTTVIVAAIMTVLLYFEGLGRFSINLSQVLSRTFWLVGEVLIPITEGLRSRNDWIKAFA
jgi:hypothetical protein